MGPYQGPSYGLLYPKIRVCYSGGLEKVSKSVQVLFTGIEAVLALTLRYHIPYIYIYI